MAFVIATFYHFFDFPDFAQHRRPLLDCLRHNQIKGTILLAAEGINGTLSGTRDAIDAALSQLRALAPELTHRESLCEHQPFGRAKVRLKKELIGLGEPASPHNGTGRKLEPEDWNRVLNDPSYIVIDARNDYEVQLGTFEGAVNPHTRNFKELPQFIRKNVESGQRIAAFCTGGIRCDKLAAWMSGEGLGELTHLQGGILHYLEAMPPEKSRWQGECYVFDERVAVGHGLTASQTAQLCKACGMPHSEGVDHSDCAQR